MAHDIRERLQALAQDAGRLADRHARDAHPLQIGDVIVDLVSIVQAIAVDVYPTRLPPLSEDDFVTIPRMGPGGGTMRVNRDQSHDRTGNRIDRDKDIAAARVGEANRTAPAGEEARVRAGYATAPRQIDMSHLSLECQIDAKFAQSIGATGVRYTSDGARFDVAMTSRQAERYAHALENESQPFNDRRNTEPLFDAWAWNARDQYDAEKMGWRLLGGDDGQITIYATAKSERDDDDTALWVRRIAGDQPMGDTAVMFDGEALLLCRRAVLICDLSKRMVIGDRAVAAYRKASKEGRRDLQNTLAPIVVKIV